jgi:vitamin B12 transporter
LSGNLDLNLSSWFLRQHTFAYFDTLSTGETFSDGYNSFNQYGASGSLAWRTGNHTIVAGTDLSDGRFKTNFAPDGFVKQWKYAVFINDTIIIDRLGITTGIRYDNMELGGDFFSPSIGITYQLSKDLLLRASVARGFHSPSIGDFVEYPGWPVNKDLNPERIMSYQIGAEANISDLVWLKFVVFRHDIDNLITCIDRDGDSYCDFTVNAYKQRVYGGELDAKTKAYKGFTFQGGVSYEQIKLIDFHDSSQFDVTKRYGINTSVTYNDNKGLRAILKGHYLWWNVPYDYWFAKYNGFVLDFNVIKEVMKKKDMSLDIFFTGHNLLNASSYDNNLYMNPSRWIEAGVRFRF